MSDLSTYNPLAAPEKSSGDFSNVARCTRNEIIDMPLAVRQAATPVIPANVYIPFWVMEYECLDTRWSDGNPKRMYFSTRLFDKDGNILDKTQRPTVCAAAYAGLIDANGNPAPIIVFPEDPSYDASLVVGNVFLLRTHKFQVGKPAPVPVQVFTPDHKFEGEVKVLQSSGEGTAVSGASIAQAATTQEATETQLASIIGAIADIADDNKAVTQKLLTSGLGNGLTIGGAGVNSLAVQGKLVPALREKGLIS